MKKIISKSLEETKKIGSELSQTLKSGDIVLLSGEMGAGKTVFTKGLADGFRIDQNITSPTFSLMNIYDTKNNPTIKKLVHIDTYRLENEEQILQIGAADFVGASGTVSVIEWPEKLNRILKGKKLIEIEIKHLDDKSREIIIK
ncbi:MAG: tRNA (adenosine(37)-N6)-threonylcarbamoyltransferase complex ATPase subunit type 1 TsaE [bacterium]|nr:tRNA (adenosine(37)-N6)-threonylcarbamoyltransferase complex ATPase subunit type 1 TsaE [bacterium]